MMKRLLIKRIKNAIMRLAPIGWRQTMWDKLAFEIILSFVFIWIICSPLRRHPLTACTIYQDEDGNITVSSKNQRRK
jgi:hypothetical protein